MAIVLYDKAIADAKMAEGGSGYGASSSSAVGGSQRDIDKAK